MSFCVYECAQVLDDNMMLCLSNGERIRLEPSMRLLFEVSDLESASPATVSRLGVVYMAAETIGWMAYVQSWLQVRGPASVVDVWVVTLICFWGCARGRDAVTQGRRQHDSRRARSHPQPLPNRGEAAAGVVEAERVQGPDPDRRSQHDCQVRLRVRDIDATQLACSGSALLLTRWTLL